MIYITKYIYSIPRISYYIYRKRNDIHIHKYSLILYTFIADISYYIMFILHYIILMCVLYIMLSCIRVYNLKDHIIIVYIKYIVYQCIKIHISKLLIILI